ncbi:MAG: lipid II flippase MurJ [Candidatus Erginobacter occultus]|nr:lipid II flippase MurJ [Candidatus Erginobacter occultus]
MSPPGILRFSAAWKRLRNSALAWDTLTTSAWNLFGRGVGFLIPFFLAAWFGISSQTDAFFFGYGLIVFIAGIFAPAIEVMTVPYIAEIRAEGGDVGRFVGRMLCWSGAGMTVLALLLVLLARPVIGTVTRFDPDSLRTISRLLLLTAPLMVLLVWTGVLTGYLNAYKKFAFPAVAPAFRAAANLAVIFALKDAMGVFAIALGYLAGEVIRLLWLLAVIGRSAMPPIRLALGWDGAMRNFLAVAFFQAISLAAAHFKAVVDKAMASWLEPGSVSVLEYAYRLYLIPLAFFSTGLFVTILSHWSERYYGRGRRQLSRDVFKTARLTAAASLLITVVVILFSTPLVRLAYGRGEFAAERVPVVSLVWICYLVGFLPSALTGVIMRGHLTLKNTKILMQNAIAMNLANILFNYLLMWRFRAAGIAFSTSIVAALSLIHLTWRFRSDPRIAAERAAGNG